MTNFKTKPYRNDNHSKEALKLVYGHLASIAEKSEVKTILEVGSASGNGSTTHIVEGTLLNPSRPKLYCLESKQSQFDILKRTFSNYFQVTLIQASSVPFEKYIGPDILLKLSPQAIWIMAQEWQKERDEFARNPVPQNGIELAKKSAGVKTFDFVYLDSGWFSADAELDLVYGAKYIALDDVQDVKNSRTHARLCADPAYQEIVREYVCNVFSVFKKL